MTRHVLPDIRPEPLASYLAGLGLVRLLGEQVDRDVTAVWQGDQLVIDTSVADLAEWLADRYVPTPVLSPWNEGSGFGSKDVTPKRKLAELVELPASRMDGFREAVDIAADVGRRYRDSAGKKDDTKARAVRDFRNRCPEQLLPWIDATVILGNEQAYFPPLLGTGGNDGRLDFSTTFHQRLLEVLHPSRHARSLSQATDVLFGTQHEKLHTEAIGQFDPAGSGGRNSSPFGGAQSLVNPWSFVLLIEGALLFAASAARRQLHHAGRAAMPFTVFASPDGSASGADGEGSRGEVWAPVWDRPFTYAEIRQLFSEARAAWRGRPAQRAVDFYAATRTFGVARGVGAFTRYGLHQRNGLAFVAVPMDRVQVRSQPEVRLAARLEDWVSWVRRGESTTAVGGAVRRFDAAHLAFARDGSGLRLAELLARLTDLEQAAGRSGRVRSTVTVRRPPQAGDFLPVLAREECPELRVAVGIASCASRPHSGRMEEPSRTMRHLLLPVDPDPRWREAPVVPGFGTRPLTSVLADVLVWRSRTAADESDATKYRGVPTFRYGIPVPAADLHAFAAGRLDLRRLDLWLRACLALRWEGVRPRWRGAGGPVTPIPTLALLHSLAAGIPTVEARRVAEDEVPRIALATDWAVRLGAGHVASVHREAVRKLRQAGWLAVPAVDQYDINGAALAAAVVPRCDEHMPFLDRHAALRLASKPDNFDDPDDPDFEPVSTTALTEEMT